MLLLLIGPFFLLSDFGLFSEYNPVLAAEFKFNFNITSLGASRESQYLIFTTYANDYPVIIPFDEDLFVKYDLDKNPETKFYNYEQTQLIKPSKNSDNYWLISEENKENL
jgi:hypothetical protein